MKASWRIALWVFGALLIVAVATITLWQYHRDRLAIAEASSRFGTGHYEAAERELADVRLFFNADDVARVRRQIADARSHDEGAWNTLRASTKAIAGAANDRNGNGGIPGGVADGFVTDLRALLARPSVMAMDESDIRKRIAALGVPKIGAVIVNDLRSSKHAARVVRFVISNPSYLSQFAAGPDEDKNRSNCFDTGLTCWYFNAAYSRLIVSVPLGQDVPSRVYEVRVSQDSQDPGTFQGARLLDWRNGLALSLAGSFAASNGGNNGETWWHLWRLDHSGGAQIDGELIPFKAGADSLGPGKVTGVVGKSYGEETTPFNECHACPHIRRDFAAVWSEDDGRYRTLSTHIHPSAYATLVRFVQEEEADQLLDATANIPHLRALRDYVNRESMAGQKCLVTGGTENETAAVTELRLECEGWLLGVKAVRHRSEWSLADAYRV